MISFMFGVLGSVVFWVLYSVFSFVIGGALLRRMAPATYTTIKTGERPMSKMYASLKADATGMVLVFIAIYLFWSLILACIVFWFAVKIIFKIVTPPIRQFIAKTADIIPDIEIKTNQKERE